MPLLFWAGCIPAALPPPLPWQVACREILYTTAVLRRLSGCYPTTKDAVFAIHRVVQRNMSLIWERPHIRLISGLENTQESFPFPVPPDETCGQGIPRWRRILTSTVHSYHGRHRDERCIRHGPNGQSGWSRLCPLQSSAGPYHQPARTKRMEKMHDAPGKRYNPPASGPGVGNWRHG